MNHTLFMGTLLSFASIRFATAATLVEDSNFVRAEVPQRHSVFGSSVAIEGNVAVVGAYCARPSFATDLDPNCIGDAYVFEKDPDERWIQKLSLVSLIPESQRKNIRLSGSLCGASVAISGDRAAVGCAFWSYIGSVFTFRREAGTWIFDQIILGDRSAGDYHFGQRLALQGSTLVVGNFESNNGSGSVSVFELEGTNWTKVARFSGDPASHEALGLSVAIDGSSIIAGAPYWTTNRSLGVPAQGRVRTYVRSKLNGEWTAKSVIYSPDGVPSFGSAVAVSGNSLAVGASRGDGRVYSFSMLNSGDTEWRFMTSIANPIPTRSDTAYFGSSLAMSGDTLVVGAPSNNSSTEAIPEKGAVHVFKRSLHGEWTLDVSLVSSETGDSFGDSVGVGSLSEWIAGAPSKDVDSGAFYSHLVPKDIPITVR